MELGNLKTKRASLSLDFDGEKINLVIRPHVLTPEYRATLNLVGTERDDDRDANCLALSELVESWDITNDGEPYPPTYEHLLVMPLALVACLADEIMSYVGKLGAPKRKSK